MWGICRNLGGDSNKEKGLCNHIKLHKSWGFCHPEEYILVSLGCSNKNIIGQVAYTTFISHGYGG